MDSLTQFTLGAVCGLALGGKKVGNKAAYRGGFLGTVPDLDVFVGPWLYNNHIDAELFHRGLTHSFTFALLAAPVFGYIISKIHQDNNFKLWTYISFFALGTHPIIDLLTGYGTQLLYPFLDHRYAIDSIFIVDPLYTLPLFIALILGLFQSGKIKKSFFAWVGLGISSCYLFRTMGSKAIAQRHISPSIPYQTSLLRISPSPFNTILWKAIAEDEHSYYFSWWSLADSTPPSQRFSIPKQHYLLEPYSSNQDIQKIITRRSPLSVVQVDNGIRLDIVRYGKLFARDDFDEKKFMFSYTIQGTGDAVTITSTWDSDGEGPRMESDWIKKLWKRIKGT